MIADENAPVNTKPTGGKSKSGKNKTIEETYTKKSQLEHILLRPDSYIGSVEKQTQPMWVLDAASNMMVTKQVTFVPGLYKIFDEIVVNAADNKQRDPSMNRIEVTINVEENFIRVWNNGSGIPIAVHQEHQIYVPELIFGNLLTGSNFDDDEAKTTGGRNGFGAKLANIFSTEFVVETADKSRGMKYRQVFTKNMTQRAEPVISKSSTPDFTCITFYPDLSRFKMTHLDDDIVSLLSKRVYDIAGTNTASGAKLNVFLNGTRIEARNFEQYIGLYQGIEAPIAFERINDRWEIGVGVSDGSFQQVSFVNSICTTKGGCHVNYIADQITSRLMGVVKKKNKGEEVKANQIKNHVSVFVNSLIVNPAFDSQTKENLTTKVTNFGSTCTVSDKMMKQVEKSGIIDNILNWAKFKQTAELKKKSGSKRSKLVGITKLDDANLAGTSKSASCTLILTEGDSAKALAISGLGVVGRDYYGVFPLKGKLLNVREASHAQIMKNEEIQNITKILGLTFGKTYSDVSSLRYGHLMIMTDQDHDGSHIKGLLINFLHHFWPSLLKIDGFLQQFITPIVKCTKGKREETFFTIPEYHNWREDHDDGRGWRIKYYKGLGTSTAAEAKEYFSNLPVHELDFAWDDNADDMIDMAFAKKRVEDRKLWLLSMEPGVHIDYTVDQVSYDNFVNHELILFSHADNERSISHFMDGLKPSQRKVLFSCFKRNLKQEIKVAQLAGYVSEHSAYHHGEASLTQTIIGMAQNFVGSNNINLLSPCGQFGTRLMGGKDAASPRYVFTKLENITRVIFHPHDDPILEYQDDDGQSIEPFHYVPVIPMALVNGSEGIGTGWSSSIPTYNPRDIIENLRLLIRGEQPNELKPWYRGFSGDIQAKTGKDINNFTVSGTIEQVDEQTVVVSELPVGKWTTDYKQFLESVLVGGTGSAGGDGPAPCAPFVKDFKENHTDTSVLFTITVAPEKLVEFHNEKGGLAKKFKLDGSVATSNMHMFDLNSQIRKYDGPLNVMADFFGVRLQYYDRRKMYLTEKLTEEWEKLDNKTKFVLAVVNGDLVVSNRRKDDLMRDLHARGFKPFNDKKSTTTTATNDDEAESGGEDDADAAALDKGYDYLLGMKIWSLTMEKVQELIGQRDLKKEELDVLSAKSAESLWLEDLDALEFALDDFEAAMNDVKKQEVAARKKAQKNLGKGGGGGGSKGGHKKSGSHKVKARKHRGSDSESDDDDDLFDDEDSDFEEKKPKSRAKTTAVSKSASSSISTSTSTSSRQAVQSSITKFTTISSSSTSSSSSSSAAATAAVSKSTATAAPVSTTASTTGTTTNATTKLKGPSKATKAPAPVVKAAELAERKEEHMRENMSLFDRLKANSSSNAAATTGTAAGGASRAGLTLQKPKPSSKPSAKAASTQASKGASKKHHDMVDLCSSEEEEEEEEEEDDDDDDFGDDLFKSSKAFDSQPVATTTSNSRAPRRAAAQKTQKYFDEEEEDDEEEEEEEEIHEDFDFHGDESEEEEVLPKKKKSSTAAAPKVSKSYKSSNPSASAAMMASTKGDKATTPPVAAKKGVKRSTKSAATGTAVDSLVTFSPSVPTPKATKKARAGPAASKTSSSSAAAGSTKSKAKAPAPVAKVQPKKQQQQKKKKQVIESEDEDDDDDEEEFEVVATAAAGNRSPKPVRARKALTYVIDDDDDDEEEDFIDDEEEEEEEDEESDFSEDD